MMSTQEKIVGATQESTLMSYKERTEAGVVATTKRKA
jgi:hypothetical protein